MNSAVRILALLLSIWLLVLGLTEITLAFRLRSA
jgi:uncharacterized membrane protein HdeD (DUF308 family)